ncbi:EAL domain-containing protein [Alteromonas sediminis]|uniref:EAL domain-containing protein n=1 Tax=Alteromonas sediminis TaxID=2259342 RepID=UPI0014049409|nr:EAL domain-containing protein [Alteromonas sediminis]
MPQFFQLSTQNGLNQDSVFAIAKDPSGRMWFGTQSGIQVWDGNTLIAPNAASGNIDLQNVYVTRLYADQDHVWIGTELNGLLRFNKSTHAVSLVDIRPYHDFEEAMQIVVAIEPVDRQHLLIATHETVFLLNKATGAKRELFDLVPVAVDDDTVIRNATLKDDTLYIGTSKGLYVGIAQNESFAVSKVTFLPASDASSFSAVVKSFHIDKQGNIFIGTARGLYKTQKSSLLCDTELCTLAAPATAVLPDRNIWAFTTATNVRGETDFWIATDDGLFAYASGEVRHVLRPQVSLVKTSKKHIYAISEDAVGNVWLGTDDKGALFWQPDSLLFDIIQNTLAQDQQEAPLADNMVWALAEAPNNGLWVGTDGGLTRLNLATSQSEHFLVTEANVSYGDANILDIEVLSGNRLLIEKPTGMSVFNVKTATESPLLTKAVKEAYDIENYLYGLGIDSEERAYFMGSTLYRFDPRTGAVDMLSHEEYGVRKSESETFLGEEPQLGGDMLFNGRGSLWRVDKSNFSISLLHELSTDHATGNVTPSSYTFTSTSLWIAYAGYGLVELDPVTFEEKSHVTRQNGLPSSIVYGLLTDSRDNIWFSSNQGLHRLTAKEQRLTNFRYGHEIPVAEFNEGAAIVLSDGRMAFGSPRGIVIFDPEKVNSALSQKYDQVVEPELTQLSLSTRETAVDVYDAISQSISLAHDDAGLRLVWSTLRTDLATDLSLEYILRESNNIVTRGLVTNGIIDFALLPPGEYQLTVQQNSLFNTVDVLPKTVSISVPYPPFRSPIAYGLYVLMAVLLLTLFLLQRAFSRKQLNMAEAQNRLFGEAFKQTRDAVVIFSKDLIPIAANPVFVANYGLRPELSDVEQVSVFAESVPVFQAKVIDKLKNVTAGEHYQTEQTWSLPGGREFDVIADVTAVTDIQEQLISHYLVVISDITEQKRAERKLQRIASYDGLTGLVNRSLLADRLDHAMANARAQGSKMAVLFIDLDRFKGVNDTLGHEIGDKLLRVIATRMRNLATPSDTVARLGGDEFVIVIEDLADDNYVASFSRELIETIEMPVSIDNEVLMLSCSIGATLYPGDGDSASELLRNADVAMYAAKKSQLNAFQFFTRSLNENANQRLRLENAVKKAYQNNGFYNVYQPIVDATTGSVNGLEMLLRAQVDDEQLMPNDFIPLLEDLRLIVEVTHAAIIRAVSDLTIWYEAGFKGYISINLSPSHFVSGYRFDSVKELLKEHDLPASAIRFEVTENILIEDEKRTLETIQACNNQGFEIMLDDFGTGYSSLSYLRTFTLQGLKIDKSFTDDIGQNTRSEALINATVKMARSLGMQVIAEGVETEEQAASLQAFGCQDLQGYYFSKPVQPALVPSLLKQEFSFGE